MKVLGTRLLAFVLAVFTVVGLSGCQTKTGAAAIIGGHRLTEDQFGEYVDAGAPSFSSSDGSTVVPRAYALQQIILGYFFQALVVGKGGAPSASELAAARVQALGGSTDSEITAQIEPRGFKAKFEPVLINTSAMLTILRARYTGAPDTALVAAARALPLKVSISPRYGTWDRANLTVTDGPATGNFLRQPAAGSL